MQTSDPALIGGVPLDAFFAFLLALVVFLFLGNLAYMLLRQALDGRTSPGTAKWAAAILQYAVIICGVYASARYLLDFDLTAVAASLGILGIIVAVSSTQITQNVLAGILITINRPVQLEEWIVVGEMPSTGLCKVHDISFTTTILQGLDGGLILTPNSNIITSKVINYSRAGLQEIAIPLTVPVTADLGRVQEIAIPLTVPVTADLGRVQEIAIPLTVPLTADLGRVQEIALAAARDHPRILPHVEPAERSAVQSLFDLPYIGRLSSDLPHIGLAIFEPKVQVTSIREEWVRLTVRVWIREIPERDRIVSGYLDAVIGRLKAEDLLEAKKPEKGPAPENPV
ncbi:Small-conductance mechanosensitive channel [Methanoculleus chikugoensis]|uniref:Small-conductance mechanosensitive channel n=1 Tax=Methanoculleus chikugoensis TaxID=118126 RepID=A0A1M4MHG5_9EURY|nr:mechanosensitive ion channel domain-containing protein [Methanoculleus chikugoensis]MDD4566836.1 mechanosensitive ion channel [Methanoculleus chikugoensis]SCL74344.1 Small-conductance mechanosensitive channel [Methanoculleus chikugoensis]